MDKETEICKMDPTSLLNPDAPLFTVLCNNPPEWWRRLAEDSELYIEIRKENKIHVYFYGARIAEIEYKSASVTAICHNKYIFGRKDVKDGYGSCIHLLEKNLKKLKDNAIQYYVKDTEGEDTSEKRIQGRLRIDNNYRYIDTEFEHSYSQYGRNDFIRFDLVAVDNNVLKIEELKRIGDSRLRTSDMENNPPEVLAQMKRYSDFIEANREELCSYYQTLLKIKAELGLPMPISYDMDKPLVLDPTPVLLIKNLYQYSKMCEKRYERIRDICATLEKNKIKYYILP